MARCGLLGTDAWTRVLTRTLEGSESACAVFLENDSHDGDPFKATRLLPAAMTKARVAVAKRAIWRELVGAAVAEHNTLHSERHFLSLVAEQAGEPPEVTVEIGRWSGSTAQDPDLEPVLRQQRAHRLRMSALPDRYAQVEKVRRVVAIVCRQMRAVRTRLLSLGGGLPTATAWSGGRPSGAPPKLLLA